MDSLPQSDKARWFSAEIQPHEAGLRGYLRTAFPAIRDIDDVVQESYLRTWKSGSGQPIRSARAFLFTVARRLALDWLRRERHAAVVDVGNSAALDVVDDGPGVVELASASEKIEILAEALTTLPPRCREVVMLYKLKGLTRSAVAGRLGIAEKTVDEQVARGMKRLEDFFRARGIEELFKS